MAPAAETHLVLTPRWALPLAELNWSYSRASGPGGQNVNKVNSRVTLSWSIIESASVPPDVRVRLLQTYGSRLTRDGVLMISSDTYRDQPRNRQDCLQRLREMLLQVATPRAVRRATRPSRGSVERRLNEKSLRAGRKQDRRQPRFD